MLGKKLFNAYKNFLFDLNRKKFIWKILVYLKKYFFSNFHVKLILLWSLFEIILCTNKKKSVQEGTLAVFERNQPPSQEMRRQRNCGAALSRIGVAQAACKPVESPCQETEAPKLTLNSMSRPFKEWSRPSWFWTGWVTLSRIRVALSRNGAAQVAKTSRVTLLLDKVAHQVLTQLGRLHSLKGRLITLKNGLGSSFLIN